MIHTRHVSRSTSQKESPLSPGTALIRQFLQIPHLTNRATPESQQILMQMIHLRNRPRLKGRRVTRHSRKIAIMQPVTDGRFARQSSKAQVIVGPRCCCMSLFGTELAVPIHEARAHEKDVSDANVAALGLRAEVDTL